MDVVLFNNVIKKQSITTGICVCKFVDNEIKYGLFSNNYDVMILIWLVVGSIDVIIGKNDALVCVY